MLCKSAGVNYATWESAVHGFGSADTLRQLRRKRQNGRTGHKPAGPRLRPPQGGSYDARIGAYVVPFPGKQTLSALSETHCIFINGLSARVLPVKEAPVLCQFAW